MAEDWLRQTFAITVGDVERVEVFTAAAYPALAAVRA
jgi:hypothetical protein